MPSPIPYKSYAHRLDGGQHVRLTIYSAGQTSCTICKTTHEAILFIEDVAGRTSPGICVSCIHRELGQFKEDHGKLEIARR